MSKNEIEELFDHSDSDQGLANTYNNRQRISDSSEEEDLFGQVSDDESVKSPLLETQEQETQEDYESESEQVFLPSLSAQENENLFLVKLPKIVSVDAQPFDPETYQDAHTKDVEDEDRNPLQVQNTIRWRYDPTDPNQKNSNARMVRWSDNSFSLLLGDELFEVPTTDISDRHQYLVVQHGGEDSLVFQSQTRFNKAMTFRPSGTHSLTHKRLTLAIAQKHKKVTRTVLVATTKDPEMIKLAAEKAEMEKMRDKKRLENKQRAILDRGGYGDSLEDRYIRGEEQISKNLDKFDEYEQDFVNDDDDDLDEEIERDGAKRLMEAKRNLPDESVQKKRLRVDDSDED